MARVFVVLCALAVGCVVGLALEPVLSQESSSMEIPTAERPGDLIWFGGRTGTVEVVERGCPVCGQLKSASMDSRGIVLVDCCRCGVVFAVRGSEYPNCAEP